MGKPTVYLAGPIEEFVQAKRPNMASGWRQYALERLSTFGIRGVCPQRGEAEDIEGFRPIATDRAIMDRDYYDCVNASFVIAYYRGATLGSQGTAMEMGWCYDKHINVCAVIEPQGNPCDHAMNRVAWTYRVEHLDSAIAIAAWMLSPYQ